MPEMITGLCKRLGYDNIDKRLLRQAVTHRSFTAEPENSIFKNNERLEFLGDSFLGSIIAEYLFKKFPNEQEGNLSRMKAVIVSEESLAEGARELGLGDYMILAGSEYNTGGLEKDSILSDAFEAVLAVIYLTVGESEARDFVLKYLNKIIEEAPSQAINRDTKGLLQEISQEKYKEIPEYVLVREEGPSNDKTFVYDVKVQGAPVGRGEGKNKKSAQKAAARDAIENYFNLDII